MRDTTQSQGPGDLYRIYLTAQHDGLDYSLAYIGADFNAEYLATAVTFFADNDDFLGGKTHAQDLIYSVKGGLIYGFRNGIWVALNGTYFTGGRTTVDDLASNDLQKNSLAGVTVALPVNRNNSVKLYANTGISTRIGADSDTIGIAWQYRRGGGL